MHNNNQNHQDEQFPLNRLPLQLREVIENLHYLTEVPIPAIASVVIGALSVATQDRIRIQKRESLISPVTLWMMVALGSGERKSTLLNEVMRSLREFETENQKKAEDAKHEYQARLLTYKSKIKEVARLMREAIRNGEETDGLERLGAEISRNKPVMQPIMKLIHEDASAAALIQNLAERSSSTSIVTDEFGFLASGRTLDRLSLLCKAYDGSEISVERRNAASVRIQDPLISLILLGQNRIIDDFVTKHWKRLEPSGFLSRFFVIASHSNVGGRFLRTATRANPKVFEEFHRRVKAILEVSKFSTTKRILRFDAAAQKCWDDYHDHVEALMQGGRYYERFRPFASRLADKAARLAAILHYSFDGAGDVPLSLLEAAIDITDWYARAYVAIFGMYGLEIDEKNGVLLAGWIVNRYNNFAYYDCPMSYLQQKGPNALRRKGLLEPTISQLMKNGCVQEFQCTGSKSMLRFDINALRQYLDRSGYASKAVIHPAAPCNDNWVAQSMVNCNTFG